MASQNPRRSGNPAVRASAQPIGSSPTRSAVAQRSKAVLISMSRLPPLVVPGVMLVLLLTGLFAPLPFALPALALIVAFIGWLAYISWPVLDTKGKLMRGLMLGVLLGSAWGRITGWL